MIRVRAPSRLHFGLLSLATAAEMSSDEPEIAARPASVGRRYGGVGLMVEGPGVQVTARAATSWIAEGPLAPRALEFAKQLARSPLAPAGGPARLVIENCAREHVGLGTGTQLALAVARALMAMWHLGDPEASALAEHSGRGRRSALGIHGFARGGLLVDGGKGSTRAIAPLVARMVFPEEWTIVLVLSSQSEGLHGHAERAAFAHLPRDIADGDRTGELCRLVLLGLLPALAERDLDAFGEALYDFNRRVGVGFAPVQGGSYASPRIAELVSFVRGEGIRGVGQSSWGPTVFAVTSDDDRARSLKERICTRFGLDESEVIITHANNRGAVTTVLPDA